MPQVFATKDVPTFPRDGDRSPRTDSVSRSNGAPSASIRGGTADSLAAHAGGIAVKEHLDVLRVKRAQYRSPVVGPLPGRKMASIREELRRGMRRHAFSVIETGGGRDGTTPGWYLKQRAADAFPEHDRAGGAPTPAERKWRIRQRLRRT